MDRAFRAQPRPINWRPNYANVDVDDPVAAADWGLNVRGVLVRPHNGEQRKFNSSIRRRERHRAWCRLATRCVWPRAARSAKTYSASAARACRRTRWPVRLPVGYSTKTRRTAAGRCRRREHRRCQSTCSTQANGRPAASAGGMVRRQTRSRQERLMPGARTRHWIVTEDSYGLRLKRRT